MTENETVNETPTETAPTPDVPQNDVAPAQSQNAANTPPASQEAPPDAHVRVLMNHKVDDAEGNTELTLKVQDEPGDGGACHSYLIEGFDAESNPAFTGEESHRELAILFQNGPIAGGVGTNGITQEVLLAIVEDRLAGFQSGKFACEENGNALVMVRQALNWLKQRTKRRIAAGTEGSHQGN